MIDQATLMQWVDDSRVNVPSQKPGQSRVILSLEQLGHIVQRAAEQEQRAILKELDTWSNLKAGKVAMLIRAKPLASRDCQRPECISHGCFDHCMKASK